MEDNLKKRFIKYIEEWEEDDNDREEWHKIDRYDQILYRTADVVEFLRREVLRQYDDKESAKSFEKVWNHILGTIEMKDYDPRKYATSME